MLVSTEKGMEQVYSEQDLTQISAQQRKRWCLLGLPALILLAFLIVSVVKRSETVSTILTLILGVLLIGGWDLFIKPLHCYQKHINDMMRGITHQVDCTFERFDAETSTVDGVCFYAMNVVCTDEDGKPYDRLFYYDAEKPLPNWRKGTPLHVTYHDRMIANVTEASE